VIRRETYCSRPPFSFGDIERQARLVLDRADQQGREILRKARARGREDAEQARQEGYQAGLAEGRQDGLRQARAEAYQAALQEARQRLDQLAQALAAGLSEFESGKRRLTGLAEAGLIELALAIARRVCKLAVEISPEVARANARFLLESVQHDGDLELRVSPTEYETLRDVAAKVLQHAERLEHVEVRADPTVEPGGCLLTTRTGLIDASIETQVQRIAEAIVRDGEHRFAPPKTTDHAPQCDG
jgi:flagellar assembly protein FliH